MTRAAKLRAMLVAAAAPTLVASEAAAEGGGWVLPGVLVGGSFASPNAFVTGVELSTMLYASRRDWVGAGAFVQAMHYGRSDSPSFGRYAGGLQIGGPIGLELGADRRSSDGTHKPTWGAHVAPYASIGFVTLAVRGTIAVTDSPGSHPGEVGVFLGFKVPFPFGDPPPNLNMAHGRPLLADDRHRVATLRGSTDWG